MWVENIGIFGGINYILEGDGFIISYNPNPNIGSGPFGSLFDSDDGGPETALVLLPQSDDPTFYILNGDFRATYERLVPLGWQACKQFFDQQAAHAESSWSFSREEAQ